jgi:hypothetical protein
MNTRTDKENLWYEILYRQQELRESDFGRALELPGVEMDK